jgi:hypothetical protein
VDRLAVITTSGDFARKLASEADHAPALDERSAVRLREALEAQRASLDALGAAVRGERNGATLAPMLNRFAGIDRHLTEEGASRADPRRKMVRTLSSLDSTLVELGESLGFNRSRASR